MRRRISVWAYPWDLADEGVAAALDWLRDAGFDAIELCPQLPRDLHLRAAQSAAVDSLLGAGRGVLSGPRSAVRAHPSPASSTSRRC